MTNKKLLNIYVFAILPCICFLSYWNSSKFQKRITQLTHSFCLYTRLSLTAKRNSSEVVRHKRKLLPNCVLCIDPSHSGRSVTGLIFSGFNQSSCTFVITEKAWQRYAVYLENTRWQVKPSVWPDRPPSHSPRTLRTPSTTSTLFITQPWHPRETGTWDLPGRYPCCAASREQRRLMHPDGALATRGPVSAPCPEEGRQTLMQLEHCVRREWLLLGV